MKINVSRIEKIMNNKLLTQGALGKAAGVSRATINTTLLKGSCSIPTVKHIAQALGVTVEYLTEEE